MTKRSNGQTVKRKTPVGVDAARTIGILFFVVLVPTEPVYEIPIAT